MAFLGMRGTGNWATNQAPENWRQMMLYLYPNGPMPLTAMTSMMGSESTNDPKFHWWTKTLQRQGGAVTGIYTNASLGAAYVAGADQAAGTTVYLKCAAATAAHFRVGHQALARCSTLPKNDITGKVTNVVSAGASSYIEFKLLEADGSSKMSSDLSACDTVLVIGSVNAQGGSSVDALGYDPVQYDGYTQIFKNSLDITRTARKQYLRTGDPYKELKRETLEYHGIEMEKAFIWSVASTGTGANGKPEYTTGGMVDFITTNASSNIFDYKNDTDYSGKTWLASGEEWLDSKLEQIFRYGSNEKMALCGSKALLGINRLAKTGGQIQIQPETASYGLKVGSWITPFGLLNVKTHPLFSFETTNQNSMIVFEPKNCKYRYVDDTKFEDVTEKGIDGTKEQYLTECGLEFHFPETFGMFNNVGVDNAV